MCIRDRLERTQLKIDSSSHNETFLANGEVLLFEGFLKVYLEGTDDELEEDQGILPQIQKGDQLSLKNLESIQRFSRPPSRFSEAALVKRLEELGIGRPSTYAPTISTIQNRGYVVKGADDGLERKVICLKLLDNNIKEKTITEKFGSNKGKLIPTDIGILVIEFLGNNFHNILNYSFSAEVE